MPNHIIANSANIPGEGNQQLNHAEITRLLYEWNDTDTDYAQNKAIHQLFEEQVEKSPENIAAITKDKQLTYRELNDKANCLAHHLLSLGVQSEVLVGININKSVNMLVGLLGILKAGGAYVPLETDWPFEHRKHILSSLNIVYLLTDSSQLKIAQNLQWSLPQLEHVICLDILEQKPDSEQDNWDRVKAEWDNLTELADNNMAANFTNSYTGLPFSQQEINEYKDHIVNLAKPYINKNSSVLEVGCGSGLIMFSLAAGVKRFVGLDPSTVAQKHNEAYCIKNEFNNIELINGFAHDITRLEPESFDLIILASTMQFFPGYQYAEKTIASALSLLKPNGILLLADIMDFARKEDFIKALEYFHKKNPYYRTKKLSDRELYFDENYFSDLTCEYPQIANVEIQHRSQFNNELSYRYDVLIQKGLAANNNQNHNRRHKNLWTFWHANQFPKINLRKSVDPNGIAYIIHTSGSTGKPKGVMVQHKPVINLIEWVNNTFHVNEDDRILAVASICFDLSVYDIFGMLAAGGSIYLVSKEELQNPQIMLRLIKDKSITFWNSAPPVLNQLVYSCKLYSHDCVSEKLRLIFLSGDWIPVDLPNRLKMHFPQAQVISLGGATEATIWSNYFPILAIDPNWKSIPYGKPIQNAKYYILDEQLKMCSIGVTGELYIGGECLAMGYRNASDEDNARFMDNPFSSDKDKLLGRNCRLYRTGDLARYFNDGNIEFLGRKDHQVKIRGFRVECGEIESVLYKHSSVKDAVVMVNETPDGKQLVAYIVPKEI